MFLCCVQGEDEDATDPKRLKLVVVGDGMCGKTCLLHRFVENRFESEHTPTTVDTQTKRTQYKDRMVDLVLHDTAGQESYDRLRPFSYKDTDVFIVCFSLDNPESLDNVPLNWVPEVRLYCGNEVPVLLVGNKCDLRDDPSERSDLDAMTSTCLRGLVPRFIRHEDGAEVAEKVGAVAYFESSAKTGIGVAEVFEAAVKFGYETKFERRRNIFGRKTTSSERRRGMSIYADETTRHSK